MATNFFCSLGIPCLLYIDDRHNGQLQVDLLWFIGYFLGLSKSILCPAHVVPYLGFLSDSARLAFCLIPVKKEKFLILVLQVLGC